MQILEQTLIEQAKHHLVNLQTVFKKVGSIGETEKQQLMIETISSKASCEAIIILSHFKDSGLSDAAINELHLIEKDLNSIIKQMG